MPEAQTYSGSCHCGAIAYTVEVDTAQALKCNCSICTKLGAVWAFAPKSKFKLAKGADKQGDYLFNKKRLHHLRHRKLCRGHRPRRIAHGRHQPALPGRRRCRQALPSCMGRPQQVD
jgi:hypothetical protein